MDTDRSVMGNRWADGTYITHEVTVMAGKTTLADGALFGILHNAMWLSLEMNGDDTSINDYDGHAWYAITHNNTGNTNVSKGTLLMAIS